VRARFELEPTSGHLFLFRNRRGDRVKILVWDTGGFWVLYKRLERGTFACLLPADSSNLRNFAKLFPAVPAASRTVTFPDAATARGASARTRRTKRY
jgi:hypothetical protein